MLTVNANRCPQNHRCPSIKVCPVEAITQDGFKLPKIDANKCVGCKKCIEFCPMQAIQEAQ